MSRPAPRSATALYATAATCATIGALLWVRSQGGSPLSLTSTPYGALLATDSYTPSAWRVWSPDVPEARLGLYLLVAGLVLAVVARLISVWRE
ncbi:hypothetical protein ACFZAU_35230 [Streptomyces sp. NPDC008238]